jgi:PhnB protein
MSRIQSGPFVNFQGRAREAMEFYHMVLGGNLDLQTLNERGEAKPAGPGDRIRYSRLDADGVFIFGSDGHPDYPAKVGEHMAIALHGSDKDRLTRIFSDLAQGGRIQMPLAGQPGGSDEGWLTDKFGISWTVNIHKA